MLCSKCGAPLNDSDKFCTACGMKVEQPTAPMPDAAEETIPEDPETSPLAPDGEAPAEPDMPTPEPEPAPKKKSHTALWIVLICTALLAAAASALLIWRPWSWKNRLKMMKPEEAVLSALSRSQSLDSVHADLNETVSASIGVPAAGFSQKMDIAIVIGADSHMDTGTGKTEGYMEYLGQKQDILSYAEMIDGEGWTYTTNNGGKTWKREKQTNAENPFLNNPAQAMELWTKHAKNLERTGTEMIGEYDTTVFCGTLSGEFLKDAAGMTGTLFGDMDEVLLKEVADLPIKIWIDNGSGRLVRMTLDMRDMMKKVLENAMAESLGGMSGSVELTIDVETALLDCTMSQFNAVPEIVIPEEARKKPAPADAGDSLVGTWTLYGGEDDETQQYVDLMLGMGMDMVFVFNEDGTGSMSMTFNGESESNDFTYTVENGEIVIDGNGAPYRIEDGLLHIITDETSLIFIRQ